MSRSHKNNMQHRICDRALVDNQITDNSATDNALAADTERVELNDQSTRTRAEELRLIAEAGTSDLSASDVCKARQALDFLFDVRQAIQESDFDPLANVSNSLPISTEIPEYIGRYQIIRSLGRGGFAEVFLARDTDLDRPVALKVPLLIGSHSHSFRERFEREGRSAAMLSHPGIVPVYEFGCIGPIAFIAYAWFAGRNMAEWMSEQSELPSHAESASLVESIADAIEHAHQRGVIHRDLKPANILVDESPEVACQTMATRLRIADFGLAKRNDPDDLNLTNEGTALGTPAYMSPEQARGQCKVDAATDIYSLGVILFELLTGQVPFRKESNLATMRAVESEEPPSLRRLSPGLCPDLAAICYKCLNKNPSHRYPTAFLLAEDLRAWKTGRPITARRANWLRKLVKWSARNKPLAAAICMACAFLGIGLALSTWKWHEASTNWQLAIKEKGRTDAILTAMTTTVDKLLSAYDPIDQAEDLNSTQREALLNVLEMQKGLLSENSNNPQFNRSTLKTIIRVARIEQIFGEFENSIDTCKRSGATFDAVARTLLSSESLLLPQGPSYSSGGQQKVRSIPSTLVDLWLDIQLIQAGSVCSLNRPHEALAVLNEVETVMADQTLDMSEPSRLICQLDIRRLKTRALLLDNQTDLAREQLRSAEVEVARLEIDKLSRQQIHLIAKVLHEKSAAEMRQHAYLDSYDSLKLACHLLAQLKEKIPDDLLTRCELAHSKILMA